MTHASAVARKELRDNLRDKGTVTMVLVFVAMIPVMLGGMFSMVAGREDALAEPPPVAVVNPTAAPDLLRHLRARGYGFIEPPARLAEAVRDGSVALALEIDPGFAAQLASGKPAQVALLVDDSRHRREADRLATAIAAYGGEIASLRLAARGIATNLAHPVDLQRRDFSTPANRAAQLLGTLVIFLTVIPFMASMGVAMDTLAGERERRSLDLLLAQPVAPRNVVVGKWLAAAAFGVTGLVLLLAVSGSVLPRFDLAAIGMQIVLPPAVLGALFLSLAPLALLAAGVQLGLSALAGSFKEAQFYMSMLLFVPMAAGFVAVFRDAAMPPWLEWVPVVAQQQHVAALVRGDSVSTAAWLAATAVTLAAVVIVLRATELRLARERT